MSSTTMRRTLAGLAAAVALTATACGASAGTAADGPGRAVAVDAGSFAGAGGASLLRSSAQGTAAISTLQVAATSTISGFSGRQDLTVTVEGSLDREAQQARLAVTTGDDAGVLGSLGDLEAVVDGGTVYLRSELLASFGGAETPWVSIDAGTLTGETFGSGLGAGKVDPTAFLDLLEGVGGPVEELGTEEVRGVDTTHVTAEITLDGLLAEVPEEAAGRVQELIDELGIDPAKVPTVPVEAWIDADGLVRKLTLTASIGGSEAEGGLGDVTVTQTVELFGFGEPVEITVPPASEVTELDLGALASFGD